MILASGVDPNLDDSPEPVDIPAPSDSVETIRDTETKRERSCGLAV
jgi:hypothetical protein